MATDSSLSGTIFVVNIIHTGNMFTDNIIRIFKSFLQSKYGTTTLTKILCKPLV